MSERSPARLEDPEISVVVPVYDEEDNVEPLCRSVREALAAWGRSWELILVDDGSRDRSAERMAAEASSDPRVRVIRLKANSGQTAAMSAGFSAARGQIVVSMDADLQNDPLDIPLLVGTMERGYDVVCGWRKDRQDAFWSRTLPSRVANRIIAAMTGLRIHDNGCSLKAYRGEVIRTLRLYSDMHRFLPALSSMTGARITEIPVRHHPRVAGRSKYGISRTFKVLADMVTIHMITRFTVRPGLWFGILALPWALLGAASAAAWFGQLVSGGTPSVVVAALAVLFLYLSGHLVSLSILSEMLLSHSDRRYLQRLMELLATVREERS